MRRDLGYDVVEIPVKDLGNYFLDQFYRTRIKLKSQYIL